MGRNVKAKKNTRQRRRRGKYGWIAVLSVILIATLCVLSLTVLFPIEQINVVGVSVYPAENVIEFSGIKQDDNLLRFSSKKVSEKIEKGLPFIGKCTVERELPGTVILSVEPTFEKYCISADFGWVTVNEELKVLNIHNAQPDGITAILGVALSAATPGERVVFADQSQNEILSEIVQKFDKAGLNIQKINMMDPVKINLFVENRFLVSLGSTNYLDGKIAHLTNMLKKLDGRTGHINLAYYTDENLEGYFTQKELEEVAF